MKHKSAGKNKVWVENVLHARDAEKNLFLYRESVSLVKTESLRQPDAKSEFQANEKERFWDWKMARQ